MNPGLSKELEKRLTTGVSLTDEEVFRLHSRHIVARDVEALEQLQVRLRGLLAETARTAQSAGLEADQFGQSLKQHKAQLGAGAGSEGVGHVVAELLSETLRMQQATLTLSQRLEANAKEVDTLQERLERAQSEALLDPLSGLKNRRGLEREVEERFGQNEDFTGTALLLADIDDFKKINDTYGHVLGDKVIRAVAQVMRVNIKGRDIAARIGGEEFAVVLPQTSADGAMALAEQLRVMTARGRIHRADGQECIGNVTISIGVAVARTQEMYEQLLQRADDALYAAKRAGRNRVMWASERIKSE